MGLFSIDPIGSYFQNRFEKRAAGLLDPIPNPDPIALRGSITSGLSSIPLAADLGAEAGRIGSLRGLDPTLLDAINTSPALQTIRDAYALADELSTVRTDIELARAGVAATKPPRTQSRIFSGALSGFATGGPFGAIAGGVGGLVKSREEQNQFLHRGENVQDAAKAISPEEVGRQIAGFAPGAREEAIASGEGGTASQNFQAAISRSGLRDSAIGSLAGVAAAALPDESARGRALARGLAATRTRVETILGSPIRPSTDRLAAALGAAAEGFLTYRHLFPANSSGGASNSAQTPIPQAPLPPMSFAEQPNYSPAGGWSF